MTISDHMRVALRNQFGLSPPQKLALAVSGGVDSMALVGLASQWAIPRKIELGAFVVDHKLRPESSEEAAAVKSYIEKRFGVPASILHLPTKISPCSDRLEEEARDGRRSALKKACLAGGFQHLLQGHHLNDQLELFIMRLLSGSSWYGLAGMESMHAMYASRRQGEKPVYVVRPLLETPKSRIIEWCTENDVQWWEDATNQDTTLTQRNLVRRWFAEQAANLGPISATNLADLITTLNRQRQLLSKLSKQTEAQFLLDGRLAVNKETRTANLTISPDLLSLPTSVATDLLMRVMAPVSPLSDDKFLNKRSKVATLVPILGKIDSTNVLGVNVSHKDGQLHFAREQPRRKKISKSYVATKSWSEWTAVDYRWFMRWRLSQVCQIDSRRFIITFAAKNDELRKRLSKVADLRTQPLLTWVDVPDDGAEVIGLPTLGYMVSDLEVELCDKEYDL